MKHTTTLVVGAMIGASLSIITLTATNSEESVVTPFITGTAPDARPPWAPRLTEADKSQTWYQRALRGISEPYPTSLRFLESQGAWYTPFTRRGMTGPYDIRDWHKR